MRTLIKNIGKLLSGDMSTPIIEADSIYIEGGTIRRLGYGLTESPEIIIDASSCTVTPGLIDSHVHPLFGEYAPAQSTLSWIRNYMHGGVTSMVSAGELHLPGLPLEKPDSNTMKSLALLSALSYSRAPPFGVRVQAGTMILTEGLEEVDFDDLRKAGSGCVKFIFYDYAGANKGEAERYVEWSRRRGLRVKIHSGGVSRSGFSRVAGWDVISCIEPDVVAHANGGPIPMPWIEAERVIERMDSTIEIASSGNPRVAVKIVRRMMEMGLLHRLILGTDTPGGTGIIPRGMLRNVAFISSMVGIAPELAICMATGNTMRAHSLQAGVIREGMPADLVIIDRVPGSVAQDALEALSIGDMVGISLVMIDGKLTVTGRSEMTPPPVRQATVKEA